MKKLICFLLQGAVCFLPAKELEGVHSATTGPCPSVEQALAKMSVPSGYAVRCFASEPMIVNPVAMSWDPRGRLWVVELYEYPSGAGKPNAYSQTATDSTFRPVIPQQKDSPRDRVIILEDTDNDGKADKRTVFAEGLNLATAILCGHGGVLIGQAPNILFLRDTNGDDKADEYKAVLTGFGLDDRHELLNSFSWGPDGWLYLTHGVFTHSKVHRPEQKSEEGVTLNAGIFRVKFSVENKSPHADDYEVYADGTSNSWGVDFDARGNAFVEACVIDHFFHMAPGGIYARQGGAPENPYAYELLPSIVGKDHPRHFRAAYAGITVYQGGAYSEDTEGHAFFGNIHDNAIHEEAMDPQGATFKARPIRDFLRANNGWFRPVSIQTGPDGFLWVMDWCDKYPCYQNALANPEGVDREKGRIWRVCYQGGNNKVPAASFNPPSRPEKDLNLAKLSTVDLVKLLENKNSWMQRQAMHQLQISPDRSALPQLLAEALTPGLTAARLMQADLVAYFTGSDSEVQSTAILRHFITQLATSPEPAMRAKAATLFGSYLAKTADHGTGPLIELAADKDATVRRAVATSLRACALQPLTTSKPDFVHEADYQGWRDTLSALLKASPEADRQLSFSIWMALEPWLAANPESWTPWLATLASTTKPLSTTLTNKTARRILDTRSPANVDLLLSFLDQIKDHDDLTAAALEGMLKAQEAGPVKPEKTDPAPFFVRWSQSASPDVKNKAARLATLWGDPAAVAAVITEAADTGTTLPRRIELLETLRKLRTPATKKAVLDLLTVGGPDTWIIPVLRAAAEVGAGDDFSTPVLKLWPAASPALHTAAAQFLTGRAEWQQRLLAAVDQPDPATGIHIPARELPATTRRFFATHSDPTLRATAERVIGRWSDSNDETKTLIASKRKALVEGEPDLARGKVLFQAICATCHKFQDYGQEVGPELNGSGRSNLDAILANVIDPNQIIGNGYQNYLITTNDGRTLGGRIVEDTPTQVTLLGIGGSREVVPTAEIAKKEDTGLSLMPMGFGNLPDDQFRDLIWYLLAPPEEGPLTSEKKEALIKGAEADAPKASSKSEVKTYPRIDWESVSLWNPDWKVTAPDFTGTPAKLTEYAGRKNVLQLHPFPDEKSPSYLSRKLLVPATENPVLTFEAASWEKCDWELVIRADGREVRRQTIRDAGSGAERWTTVSLDLAPWRGKKVNLQLENHPTGWEWEYSYWSDLKITP